MAQTVHTIDERTGLASSYRLINNLAERANIIAAIDEHGATRGRGGAGQYWVKANKSGQMMIGYHPRENMTYFHGLHGVLVHEERGDTLGLAI